MTIDEDGRASSNSFEVEFGRKGKPLRRPNRRGIRGRATVARWWAERPVFGGEMYG